MERCDCTGLSFTSIDLDDYAATCDRIAGAILDGLSGPATRTLLDDLLRLTALAEHLRLGARLVEDCGAEPAPLVEVMVTPCAAACGYPPGARPGPDQPPAPRTAAAEEAAAPRRAA